MKVTEHIAKAKGKTLFSFEVLPPLKGQSIQQAYRAVDQMMEYNPSFINVTYHREEYIFKPLANGFHEKKVVRKRPGTVGMCAALQSRYKIDTIPHILCGGFSKEETENFLIDLDFLEIDNVLALRGDPVKGETYFQSEAKGNNYAKDLILQIKDLNNGIYQDEDLQNPTPTNFCIGSAGYPEKHMEAPNLDTDILKLKEKVDAGAEYIITQMFFDNQKYFSFVEKCREAGIDIPIIPGLKPLSTQRQLSIIPHRFHVDLPEELVIEAVKCKTKEEVTALGVEWCIAQSKELKKYGVPSLHYYSMGKTERITKILKEVF
ncbi:MAG: methylenetetrahydrofolate reductase [NAD(P)H] [Flavobacteriales bacterium]|nr:methylenetetrahydrofolate reductase [NAD(P)H] [Flavobacteriales bacterium]